MRYLRFFGASILVATLWSCSDSGSSNDLDATTSTNTVPTPNNTGDAGTSTGPSSDQPTTAGDTSTGYTDGFDTDGSGDADDGIDTDGGTDSSAGSNTEDNGNTNSDGGNTDEGDTGPIIDPDSALGRLQSRIKLLSARTLLALNQSLNQGVMLSAQQEQCLGTYDPAIGQPLLAIDCDQPLATGEVPIFVNIASLQDTPDCQASLQNANADACSVNQAEFSINPIFTTPETGRPQVKQAGAAVSYNIVQDHLILQNVIPALTGTFFCKYDLINGNAIGGDPGGDCYNQVNRIFDLIDEQLALEH